MPIWFGINEYHFECKGDIDVTVQVGQRKPEKKIRFQDSNPSKKPRPWCITVKDLKLSTVLQSVSHQPSS